MDLASQMNQFLQKPEWKRRPEVLLCANTVKPMHGVVPRVILGKEWWDETRRLAYASTNFHCIACGVSKWEAKEHQWLEGHELYKIDYVKGRQTYIETVPLCHYCHNFIHDGRLQMLVRKDQTLLDKYKAVVEHGREVLQAAGLKKRPHHGYVARWETWRLILNGREYPPIYKDYSDWLKRAGKDYEE